ncbi:ribonuclease P protein component [bacterium]|nr:ribonuclease P protein component [bacterium]
MHLRKRFEYNKIRKTGKKFYGRALCFQFIYTNSPLPKLGITVSRKFGGAVKRNFFKRRVREVFRKKQSLFPTPIAINILPLERAKTATYEDFLEDFDRLIEQELTKEFIEEKEIELVKG